MVLLAPALSNYLKVGKMQQPWRQAGIGKKNDAGAFFASPPLAFLVPLHSTLTYVYPIHSDNRRPKRYTSRFSSTKLLHQCFSPDCYCRLRQMLNCTFIHQWIKSRILLYLLLLLPTELLWVLAWQSAFGKRKPCGRYAAALKGYSYCKEVAG